MKQHMSCIAQVFYSIEVHVRLWYQRSFFVRINILMDRTVGAVTECIFNSLNKYHCVAKVVSRAYDGAMVMAYHLNGVQFSYRKK